MVMVPVCLETSLVPNCSRDPHSEIIYIYIYIYICGETWNTYL